MRHSDPTTTLPRRPATTGHTTVVVDEPAAAPVPFPAAPRELRLSEPVADKIRGPRLLLIWAGLAAGAWAVAVGIGYGVYGVVQALPF